MKKLLLVLGFACASVLSQAQTLFWQNFEVSKNVMPAGWSVDNPVPVNKGWVFNNAYGTKMASAVATHTYCAFVDDWDNNGSYLSLVDTLKTIQLLIAVERLMCLLFLLAICFGMMTEMKLETS